MRQFAVLIVFVAFSIGGQLIPMILAGEQMPWHLLPMGIVSIIMTTFFEEFLLTAIFYICLQTKQGVPISPLETITLQQINEERYKEYIGEGQLFFNMKRLHLPITSYDGTTTYTASKYVVPIPDIEKENRY